MIDGVTRIKDSKENLFQKDHYFLFEMLSKMLKYAIENRQRETEYGFLI